MDTPGDDKKESRVEKPPESPKEEEGAGPVGDLLTTLDDVQVGMKLEAKDAYGKWYVDKNEW